MKVQISFYLYRVKKMDRTAIGEHFMAMYIPISARFWGQGKRLRQGHEINHHYRQKNHHRKKSRGQNTIKISKSRANYSSYRKKTWSDCPGLCSWSIVRRCVKRGDPCWSWAQAGRKWILTCQALLWRKRGKWLPSSYQKCMWWIHAWRQLQKRGLMQEE